MNKCQFDVLYAHLLGIACGTVQPLLPSLGLCDEITIVLSNTGLDWCSASDEACWLTDAFAGEWVYFSGSRAYPVPMGYDFLNCRHSASLAFDVNSNLYNGEYGELRCLFSVHLATHMKKHEHWITSE